MLPEEAAEKMLNSIIEQDKGQSLIIDIDTLHYGKYGFYENSNLSHEPVVKSSEPNLKPDDSEISRTVSLNADLDTNLSLKVRKVIAGNLNVPDIDLFDGGLGITPGWDSLRHIGIILDLEEQFNCQFSSSDIDKLITVREIIQTINNLSLGSRKNGE